MRIYSPKVWLLSASLAGIAVASINITSGLSQDGNTTILTLSNLERGYQGDGLYTMDWRLNEWSEDATVDSVILAEQSSMLQIAQGINTHSTPRSFPPDPRVFSVDTGGSLTFNKTSVLAIFTNHTEQPLFFQFKWNHKGSTDYSYSYSLPWAVVEDDTGVSTFAKESPTLVTTGSPVYSDTSTPKVNETSEATPPGASSDASSSSTTTAVAASSSAAGSGHKSGSGGLSTGAIVGIAIGCAAALIIISVIAGCFCFRRRKNDGVRGEDGNRDVHMMQDIIAEKEARVGILDGDQPDTPYSEQGSNRIIQQPLGRGLGMTGTNESGVDMGMGQAITRDGNIPSEGHYTTGNDRNSGVYSSLGGAPNPVTSTPVAATAVGRNGSPTRARTSTPVNERTSMMSSPVPRTSNQQDRAFSPYTDHPVPSAAAGAAAAAAAQQQHEYDQHHRVVDGADLVQQEQSNDRTARSPTRAMTPDQQQQQQTQQPISPETRDGGSTGSGTPRMRAARFGSRSATPSGISGRYAHLVEDGMSDDEIRRLEEEERALDEAIEQAGRR